MSCYIVEKNTIDRILSFIYAPPRDLWLQGRFKEISSDDLDDLGQQMIELNITSVGGRYGDKSVETMPGNIAYNKALAAGEKYEYQHAGITPAQAFMTLSCYLYQSCEGNCDKKPLYKELDELRNRIACFLARRQAHNEGCDWG